jgi:hypothetical protein
MILRLESEGYVVNVLCHKSSKVYHCRLTCPEVRKHEVENHSPFSGSSFLILFSVSLARAVYSRASVLLLDDPLSAGEYSDDAVNNI